jgi:small-conductance mechanosensitive channel
MIFATALMLTLPITTLAPLDQRRGIGMATAAAPRLNHPTRHEIGSMSMIPSMAA